MQRVIQFAQVENVQKLSGPNWNRNLGRSPCPGKVQAFYFTQNKRLTDSTSIEIRTLDASV